VSTDLGATAAPSPDRARTTIGAAGDASVIADALLAAEGRGDPTDTMYPGSASDRPGWHVRLFGTHEFFRLWLVQVVSSMGDWLGFSAIILLAARIGDGGGAGAISLVMAARIIPGFFFGPLAGVLVDRWDRKRVMVVCDVGRACVIATLPFVNSLAGLVVASLVLEVFTLLWSPAKDATVPNLVPQEQLTTANSLSLGAAYGTFPFAALLFALLAGVSERLSSIDALSVLRLDQMSLALYVDVATFLFSALMIRSLALPVRAGRSASGGPGRVDFAKTFHELKEGWHYIFLNHTVRAVNVGLATGLIGGGMLIPLGAVFSTEVLGAGAAGYGLFTTALGFGVAAGAIIVSALQKRLPKAKVFTTALFFTGAALFAGTSTSSLTVAVVSVFLMGVFVGPVYVIGFVMLQEEVTDELRGRVFSSLNTLVRLCVLVAMIAGPLLAAAFGRLSDLLVGGAVEIGSVTVALPGVRLALWLAAGIITAAGFLALHSLRSGQRLRAAREASHPSRHDLSAP
jgi:dTMP kinase